MVHDERATEFAHPSRQGAVLKADRIEQVRRAAGGGRPSTALIVPRARFEVGAVSHPTQVEVIGEQRCHRAHEHPVIRRVALRTEVGNACHFGVEGLEELSFAVERAAEVDRDPFDLIGRQQPRGK